MNFSFWLGSSLREKICSYGMMFMVAVNFAGCRTSSPEIDSSVDREFEDAMDICKSVRLASRGPSQGGTAASEASRFKKLRAVELNVLEGIIDALATNKAHLLANASSQHLSPDAGSDQLPDERVVPRDDHGICPNCEIPEVDRRLGYYQRQKAALSQCSLNQNAPEVEEPVRTELSARTMLTNFIKSDATNGQVCATVEKILADENAASCRAQALRITCSIVLGESRKDASPVTLLGDAELRAAAVQCIDEAAGPIVASITEAVLSAAQKAYLEGKDARTIMALAACEGGAKILGHTVSETPQVDFENACSALNPLHRSFKGRSRMVSCLRTGRDVCEIFFSSGKLDIDRLLENVEGPSMAQARQVIRAADTELCSLSGEVSLACNLIRKASEQIREAIKTGNNDWAHCLGTDQLGACIGTLWGQRGWSNNSGVASAVREGDLIYRPCCWCYKDHFIDDSWLVADTRIKRDNWFGVIQEGDVATGNCKYQEKIDGQSDLGETYRGKKTYARYLDCGKWYVEGDRCAVPPGHRHQIWDGKNSRWFQVTAN